jgi:hypothetical protein
MFVVKPRLAREIARQFQFVEKKEGEQQDYSINGTTMEVPLLRAALIEDRRKTLTKAKAGDIIILTPAVEMKVKHRIIHVELHEALYDHGKPTFKRLYRHDDKAFSTITWECTEPYDLEKLPYLLEVYIVDEHVR